MVFKYEFFTICEIYGVRTYRYENSNMICMDVQSLRKSWWGGEGTFL